MAGFVTWCGQADVEGLQKLAARSVALYGPPAPAPGRPPHPDGLEVTLEAILASTAASNVGLNNPQAAAPDDHAPPFLPVTFRSAPALKNEELLIDLLYSTDCTQKIVRSYSRIRIFLLDCCNISNNNI